MSLEVGDRVAATHNILVDGLIAIYRGTKGYIVDADRELIVDFDHDAIGVYKTVIVFCDEIRQVSILEELAECADA